MVAKHRLKTLLVANPKGGSGKTTLATNIAGYLAAQGRRVGLLDLDRQRSASEWLALRAPNLPAIEPYQAGTHEWLVIDSPAGLHGKMLERALKLADRVIVPIAPSMFDMAASSAFLDLLKAERDVRRGKTFVGLVGMRIDPRTKAGVAVQDYLERLDLPILAYLRYAQSYVSAAFEGQSLFDLPPYLAERELEQWTYLIDWINHEERA